MFVPAVIVYLVFCYTPMYGIIIAFKDYKIMAGILKSEWVGLDNFNRAIGNPDFFRVFGNTLIISTYKLLFGFPAPIILALCLNELRNVFFKKTVQTISYMPHFISWVVLGGIFINFFSPSTGIINYLIKASGGKPINFLADIRWFRTVLVTSSIWKGMGWSSVIYLAAISGVNTEMYDSAAIDGAGRFKQIIHITLPSITQVIVIQFIFAVGSIVGDDFDQIFNLYNATVYSVGDVLSTYVYRQGLEQMKYSYSTAVGLFRMSIAFVLILLTNTAAKRVSDYGLW
jgi:putative aldouronate transport system permease protein